jgi:hypothetical protein
MKLVFMLEEPSMKHFLDGLLPRVFPQLAFQCIAHEGKSDLERSLPRKLRGWREPGVRFVVMRDNDGGDCAALKKRLLELCAGAGREDTLVRIACQELEAWYLGDMAALGLAYGRDLSNVARRRTYRDPDAIGSPSAEVKRLVPPFQKVDGARRMGARVTPAGSRSRSFRVLLEGVARICGQAMEEHPHA